MKASGTKLTQLECVKAGTVWAGTQPGRRKKYSTILLPVQKRRTTRTLYLTSANNPNSQNCLRRCMKVAHMAKLSPIRVLQLSVKRLAQCELARSIGSSTPT